MDQQIIQDLVLTELNIIKTDGGDVLHGMKKSDPGFISFGEAYFSTVTKNSIKAWKRHHKMTMNLIVPSGEIGFGIFDDREESESFGKFSTIVLSQSNYFRLTVPPMLWLGFKGLSKDLSYLLNIADIAHDPNEVDHLDLNEIDYDWSYLK